MFLGPSKYSAADFIYDQQAEMNIRIKVICLKISIDEAMFHNRKKKYEVMGKLK